VFSQTEVEAGEQQVDVVRRVGVGEVPAVSVLVSAADEGVRRLLQSERKAAKFAAACLIWEVVYCFDLDCHGCSLSLSLDGCGCFSSCILTTQKKSSKVCIVVTLRVQGRQANGDVLPEYRECEKISLSASRLLGITNCLI